MLVISSDSLAWNYFFSVLNIRVERFDSFSLTVSSLMVLGNTEISFLVSMLWLFLFHMNLRLQGRGTTVRYLMISRENQYLNAFSLGPNQRFPILLMFKYQQPSQLSHLLGPPIQFKYSTPMGNNDSSGKLNPGILQYMREEYERVLREKNRKHLILSEVLEIHPHEDFPFDFRHFGILFVCDRELDGLFSFDNFEHFALWIQLNLVSVQMYEFKSQLQARTVAQIIDYLNRKDGESALMSWFLRMLLADKPNRTIRGNTYIKIDAIKLIYEIMNIKIMNDIDIQTFFFLIKKSAEEMGFPVEEVREIEEEEDFQEYIQIGVCKQFVAYFLKGAAKILKQIGYNNKLI